MIPKKKYFMIAKSKINAAWHKANRMPKNPTIEQRIQWHLEHLKNCHCRTDIPEGLKQEMKKRKITIPSLLMFFIAFF
jgi:hypothetical protein